MIPQQRPIHVLPTPAVLEVDLVATLVATPVATLVATPVATPEAQTNLGLTPTGTATPSSISMGGSYGNGNEPGIADAGQTIEYYKLNNPPIVVHGAGSNTVVWSSQTDLSSGIDPYILKTDSRLNLRVIPRIQNANVDGRGYSCYMQPLAYTKLNVGVRVRKQGSTSGDYHQFQQIRINGASKVHEFSVPTSSYPLVIDVLNVEWDYECIYYALDGYANYPYSCPMSTVWPNDCVSFDIQFSTDDTKDIPGTRSYQ